MSMPWLLVAVPRERRRFRPRITHTLRSQPTAIHQCELDGRPFVLGETGVGGRRVVETLDWLQPRVPPTFVFMAGFAGALTAELRVGDGISIGGVVGHVSHDATLPLPTALRTGRILTSDQFIGEPAEKRRLADEHGALAVEMETAYLAAWCASRGLPWGGVRVISDDAHAPVPREVFELFEDGVSMWRVMKAIVRNVSIIRDLRRLAQATDLASKIIAEALTRAARQTIPL